MQQVAILPLDGAPGSPKPELRLVHMDETAVIEPIEAPETTEAPAEVIDELGIEGDPAAPAGGETEESKEAPEWVRELRKQNRELRKQLRASEHKAPEPANVQVAGAKPTLESCDFDAEKFSDELDTWHANKRKADDAESDKRKAQEAEMAAWDATVAKHKGRVSDLTTRVPKAAEYIAEAEAALSPTQAGMVLHTSPESHRVLAVLGKNADLLEEVSNIKDPALFVRRIVELEMSLTGKKPRTAPERPLTGAASGAKGSVPGSDATMERLEAEADRTGDRTKLIQHMRAMRNSGKENG